MEIAILIICVVIGVVAVKGLSKGKPKARAIAKPLTDEEKGVLQKHVLFYQRLSDAEKLEFESRVSVFLQSVIITGVKTEIETLDKVFVAAGAVIPVFAFKGWGYRNINEVLIYPGSFNQDYQMEGDSLHTLGMVGSGAMNKMMILSQQSLRHGFMNKTDKSNVAIHEFVHLVDKDDGYVDGCPETLLPYKYSLPWLKRIHQEVKEIHEGESDLNPYGATNEAEFLAVAAEYFFERPGLMKRKNPELYADLEKIFKPDGEGANSIEQ